MSRNYYRRLIEATPPPAGPLFANAVAYYKLDETSGQAIDAINGYNGDLYGGITQGVVGKTGTAYEFNGSTGYLEFVDTDDFSFTDGTNNIPFTLRCWVKFDTLSSNPRLFQKKSGGSFLELTSLVIDNSIRFFLWDSVGNPTGVIGETSISTNTWYHLVFVKGVALNNTDMKIYINAVEESYSNTLTSYNGNNNSSAPLKFGASEPVNAGEYGNFINGIAYELCVIKGEAWTPAQVAADYNNGLGSTI